MNHGSLGYLNEVGQFFLEPSLLTNLRLGDNSKLYGIYYPCPANDESYKNVTLRHDFMLTPIPPRLWAVSARIHIHHSHDQGSIKRICEFFKEQEISIIIGESTRSAYRYDTWSVHIAFQKLARLPKLTYNVSRHVYEETFAAVEQLKRDISSIPELNVSISHPEHLKSIEGLVNFLVAHFTNFIEQKHNNSWIKEPRFIEPFELTLHKEGKHEIFSGDSKFDDLIKYLKFCTNDILPAITFSDLDTRGLNLRTVLIPQQDCKRFFLMGVEYERAGGEDNCVGVIHHILDNLPESYNIWQSYNYLIDSSDKYESGNFTFFVEDTINVRRKTGDNRSKESITEEACENLKKAIETPPFQNIRYKRPTVIALPNPASLKLTFEMTCEEKELKDFKYDLFISYSHLDQTFVEQHIYPIFNKHNLKTHLDKNVFKYGEPVDDTLLLNILASREMCVVISENSVESEWVTTEWGAAWILGKKLTPIVIPSSKLIIPERLKNRHWASATSETDLEQLAREIIDRKDKVEALRFRQFFNK